MLSSLKNSRTQTRPPQAPGRIYALIVVTLAVTVAGLVFWRNPATTHIAAATIEWLGPGDAAVLTPHIRQRLVGEEFLSQCLKKAGPFGQMPPSGEFPTKVQTNWLRNQIGIHPVAGKPKQFRISIAHTDRQRAVQLVDAVTAELLIHIEQARASRQMADEIQRLEALRDSEAAALEKVNTLVEDVVAVNGDDAATVQPVSWLQGNQAATPANTAELGQDELGLNPEWLTTQERLHDALDRRNRLRSEFRPDDPEMVRVDKSIRALQKALNEIPRDIKEIRRREAAAAAARRPEEARQELRGFWEQYRIAREQRVAAEAEILSSSRIRPTSPAAAFVRRSAHLSEPIRSSASSMRGIFLGIVGLVFGGATVFLITPNRKLQTIYNSQQLEDAVAAPVVGSLPASENKPPPEAPKNPNQVAWIMIRTAEVLLGLVVAGVLLVALVDSTLTYQFSYDPLAAFGEAFARILNGRF